MYVIKWVEKILLTELQKYMRYCEGRETLA